MPTKPPKPCKHPMCSKLTHNKYCDDHKGLYVRESSSKRGYDYRWQAARKRYLKLHPLCVECYKCSKYIEATVVDHIVPHRGDQRLMWDENNWQALCKPCHDRKTGSKDRFKEYKY